MPRDHPHPHQCDAPNALPGLRWVPGQFVPFLGLLRGAYDAGHGEAPDVLTGVELAGEAFAVAGGVLAITLGAATVRTALGDRA